MTLFRGVLWGTELWLLWLLYPYHSIFSMSHYSLGWLSRENFNRKTPYVLNNGNFTMISGRFSLKPLNQSNELWESQLKLQSFPTYNDRLLVGGDWNHGIL